MSHPASTDRCEGTDPQSPEFLSRLNQIGAAINRLTPRGYVSVDVASVADVLTLIIKSASDLIPGSMAAVYSYDAAAQALTLAAKSDSVSHSSTGDPALRVSESMLHPDDLGMRAIRRRQLVLSYDEPDLPRDIVAVASFPLVVSSQPVGLLDIYSTRADRFTSLHLLVGATLANYAAMAIYQSRRMTDVQRDLVRSEEAVDRLWRAGMLISSRLGLDETLGSILQMALDVTGAHHGIFRLVDEAGEHLVARAIAGAPGRPQLGDLGIDGSSIMGWVAAHRQPLCIHDLEAAPWVQLYQPLDADLRMRSELAVPLVGAEGRLEGVLNLESPLVGAFDDQDRHLLQSLATQAVIAIQEARLLDALLEAARLLLFEPAYHVLQRLVMQACDLLNASASAIWLREGDELALITASAPQEMATGLQRGDRLPLVGSLTGQVVLQQVAVTSDDVRQDARFFRPDLAREQAWTRALIVPLLAGEGEEALGAFSVYGAVGEPGRFTESKWGEKVLTCLAHYAALALQSSEHQRMLRLAQERQAVAETFAAVGDVAANVLHHLNNKVGTIPVRVQGIQDKSAAILAGDAYLAANLTEIERSAREAMDAVRDSLTHLRPMDLAPVSVAQCVDRALVRAALPDTVQVYLQQMADLPKVVASERGLSFVFTNLLENASAAMEGVGEIAIRGWVTGLWVEMEVADDGPGIPEAYQEHIFEFSSADHGVGRGGKLGFGLWWVKTLLMRLGGTVTVESDGVRGTRFRLRLPRAEATDG
jgi:signal transduction histidine kinase/putative methionine-R-sulfoxide reductase with GAF domain